MVRRSKALAVLIYLCTTSIFGDRASSEDYYEDGEAHTVAIKAGYSLSGTSANAIASALGKMSGNP